LHADSYIVLNRVKNHFFQLLNVFWVNDISQTEMHRAGGLCDKVEVAIEKLRRHK